MKAAVLIILSLSALAYAGPAFNKNNQIEDNKVHKQQHQQQQQQQYMTQAGAGSADYKSTQATEILKQWCYSSQMSQPELTSSFKKLVSAVKSSPENSATEAAVMGERICQGTAGNWQQKSNDNSQASNGQADAQAHELIKDVYMDALIACDSRDCMSQLVKIINSNKVDTIRASYYMTRIAVTESEQIKDERDVQELADTFVAQPNSPSDAIERQRLFAVTALLGKSLKNKDEQQASSSELKQTADKVAKTIVEQYINQVSSSEVAQYQQQQPEQQSQQVAKKIAKRNAALKALANIPGYILKDCSSEIEQSLMKIAQDKQDMVTARQSAIEALEENEQASQQLKQIAFSQDEPIEVRVAALRAATTTAYAAGSKNKDNSSKQQEASQLVDQLVKHCEDSSNQDHDDQFVLYATSYLDNMRTSQQPEHEAIKESIGKNKQHSMAIQVLNKKFKQQLADVRKSSRNYKLEQEFNQIESGLVIEGDLVYESKKSSNQYNQAKSSSNQGSQGQGQILPKLVRFNMSMPMMGKTVNVFEVTVRQNQMDDELLGALKLVQGAKFNSDSVSKVVDSFKSSVEQSRKSNTQQGDNKQQSAEADLSIKVDGCTVVYVSVDDFKSSSSSSSNSGYHQRNTRSANSIVDEIIEHLKRKPVAFNRGFNFNMNQRLAKVLDVDANIIAGLRFMSRASGQSSKDFEIAAQVEPRFAFEAIVGPAKVSSKKLLQRVSTKTALGMRLRFKSDQLVDVQVDLPMENMELFTVETQMVEKSQNTPSSYSYLPESIYGQGDIYDSLDEMVARQSANSKMLDTTDTFDGTTSYSRNARMMKKRSIFESSNKSALSKSINKLASGKSSFAHSLETSEDVARATGLRAKLRVAASPADLSFLVQAFVQKYEPSMQGYRVQVQKNGRNNPSGSNQYVLTLSTPGSRYERTMQVRLAEQSSASRTYIKTEMSSPKMAASAQYEIIYDGRQYAVKAEIASTRGKQWRHSFEAGVQRSSSSPSGRVASSYKPYLSINSSALKRPVQMQGVVAYQQSPKSVISYELKCSTTGDFVSGKFILDERSPAYLSKRSASARRSMQSPIEIILNNDITFTSEFIAQVANHAVKSHKMIDWDSSKGSVNADLTHAHKNLRKQTETAVSGQLKLEAEQQMLTVQRKSTEDSRKDFRLTVVSDTKSQSSHQLAAECRYSSKRANNQVAAYKHKLDFSKSSSNKKIDLAYNVELVSTEHNFNEKITGRTYIGQDRNTKTVHTDMSCRDKNMKLDLDYESLQNHQVQVAYQSERFRHTASVRADKRNYSYQSRTEKRGQLMAKIVLDVFKQQAECQLLVEAPTKNAHVAADLKLASGKTSSWSVQTPRFASKAEFSFDKMSRNVFNKRNLPTWMKPISAFSPSQLRFKTDLKDSMNQEAYWLDSNWNKDSQDEKSYLRFDSPAYRTELEFDPRNQNTKFGSYARSKRSVFAPYSSSDSDSIFGQNYDSNSNSNSKLDLSNKLWMLRSIVASPSFKQQARRALFEYADRRQQHKHSFDYSPAEERLNFKLERQPSADYSSSISPMRLAGDLATNFYNYNTNSNSNTNTYSKSRPSSISMNSNYVDFELAGKPYDGEESYATLSALSRNRRSPFKKHESEIRYKKNAGYSAKLNHQDAMNARHSFQMEADQSPKKWAKMSYDSDKHGKASYQHQWRKQTSKRSPSHYRNSNSNSNSNTDDYYNQDVYANKIAFSGESPAKNWAHSTSFDWEEPTTGFFSSRVRRDIYSSGSEAERKYNAINYFKHINARLNSQTSKNSADLYKLDFDYQPSNYAARLNLNMPQSDLLHASAFEYEPSERLYKLTSKSYSQRTNQPHYEFLASTKPVLGLASANQEAVFIDQSHPMLERPISASLASQLFNQPMKLDYSDKYGRVARFDYDHSPISNNKYAGLRQKRAALYYKDNSNDFEHDSSYDFYPEAMLGGFKKSSSGKRIAGDYAIKTNTKYGPIMLKADSDDKTTVLKIVSPVLKGQLTAESSSRNAQLIKIELDNKSQSVQVAKLIRQNAPVLRDIELVQTLAQKFDNSRFEHQAEALVSIIDAIFKVKSQTKMNNRTVMTVDGEFNKQQEKAFVKINGERTKGQVVVDLINNSADLVLEVDNKRTLQHQTRIEQVGDNFYSLKSSTTYKQQPLLNLSGKICSKIFSEPEHLFESRRQSRGSSSIYDNGDEHVSTFDAEVYGPKGVRMNGRYDCLKKEARVIVNNQHNKEASYIRVQYDEQTDQLYLAASKTNSHGIVKRMSKTIDMAPLVSAY